MEAASGRSEMVGIVKEDELLKGKTVRDWANLPKVDLHDGLALF